MGEWFIWHVSARGGARRLSGRWRQEEGGVGESMRARQYHRSCGGGNFPPVCAAAQSSSLLSLWSVVVCSPLLVPQNEE